MSLFHRHKWTDWAISDRGKITYYSDIVGWYLVQQRHCLVCGKTQVDDQAEYAGATRALCRRVPDARLRVPRKDGVAA